MRILGSFFITLSVLALGLGFFGQIHASLDTLSLGRPVFALVSLFGLFTFRRPLLRFASAAVACFGLVTVGVPLLSGPEDGALRLYSKNVFRANSEPTDLAQDILAQDVDVVMLQEVSRFNQSILDMLRTEFPHQHVCNFSNRTNIAVLSRHAFAGQLHCSETRAIAAAQIELSGTRVWIVSAHIPWPWPNDARRAEAAAYDVLSKLDGTVVMAGDFNMLPWTARVHDFARATQTRLAGPMRTTFRRLIVPLSIDHVMAPGGGHVEVRPMFGSDHAGLVAEVSL